MLWENHLWLGDDKRQSFQRDVTPTLSPASVSSDTLRAIHRLFLCSVTGCLYQLFITFHHTCSSTPLMRGEAEEFMLTVPISPRTCLGAGCHQGLHKAVIRVYTRLSSRSTQGLTLTGVHGKSGNAAATARAPASFVHSDRPTKNSRPRIVQKCDSEQRPPWYSLWLVKKCSYGKRSFSNALIKAHHSTTPEINSIQFISL